MINKMTKTQKYLWTVGFFVPTLAILLKRFLLLFSQNIKFVHGLEISAVLSLIICSVVLAKSEMSLRAKCITIFGTVLLLAVQIIFLGLFLAVLFGLEGTR